MHRLSRATNAFWSMCKYFCCREVSLVNRLRELYKRILPVAVYGSGSLVWSLELRSALHTWENTMLRTIHGYRRRPDESHSMCVQGVTYKMRTLYHGPVNGESGARRKCICQLVLEKIHRLAGSFRDLRHDLSSQRVLPQILSFRDTIWWLWQQAAGTAQALADSSWRYPQRGRPARHLDWVFVNM